MLLEYITEMQNPSVVYEDNQEAIFLANNRKVCMRTKHIDIRHHFLRDMVDDKDIDIKYIRIEENPADIMMKNCSEADYVKHMKRIKDGEICGIVETGRGNLKNIGVMD